MIKLYRWLLFLYPSDYRAVFGAEMIDVFADIHAEASEQGVWKYVTFCLRELIGLLRTAVYARVRVCGGSQWLETIKRLAQGQVAVTVLILGFFAVVTAIEVLKSFALHGPRSRVTAPPTPRIIAVPSLPSTVTSTLPSASPLIG